MHGLKVEDMKADLKNFVDAQDKMFEREKLSKLSDEDRKKVEDTKLEQQKKELEEKSKKEEQEKKDVELQKKKAEELTDDEKKRIDQLNEEKRIAEEAKLSAEEKVKRVKEESQKRINEVVNEMKQIKDKTSKEFDSLQDELKLLKQQNEELIKKVQPELPDETSIQRQATKNQQNKINQYIQEDAKLPRENRREMSDEELDEWLLEDTAKAHRWIARQELRRERELSQEIDNLNIKYQSDYISKKQIDSIHKLVEKYPDLKNKDSEIAQGFYKFVNDNINKYGVLVNGPEEAMKDYQSNINLQKNNPVNESKTRIEALEKEIEILKGQLQSERSDEGITSSIQKSNNDSSTFTSIEKMQMEILSDRGMTEDEIRKFIETNRQNKRKV